jgi:serine/threonine protein kinase/CheY-like chemotaxis protein
MTSRVFGPSLRRTGQTRTAEHQPSAGQVLLFDLLAAALVLTEDWETLAPELREEVLRCREQDAALDLLVRNGLLTMYQAARVTAGTTFGLVLGNYRVLERLGAGGMAVVFKAEHIDLRHQVALKVLPLSTGQDVRLLSRFFAEMRVVARLRHPNIVAAIDAGKAVSDDPDAPELRYFVMEYVPGQDLEEYVLSRGALSPAKACNVAHQVACALGETYKFNLVHRDIKPSNILLTSEEQAKLLDFGLMRDFSARLTQPGTVVGTLDFMAPEQAQDATTVDVRADLYGLGGTLFWCLTGKLPFPSEGSVTENLIRRLSQAPPSVRRYSPRVPTGLDALVARLMAVKPEDRFQTPQEVMRALLPYLKPESPEHTWLTGPGAPASHLSAECQRLLAGASGEVELAAPGGPGLPGKPVHRILIIDDEEVLRNFCTEILQAEGIQCDAVGDGDTALEMVTAAPYDLALLDVNMQHAGHAGHRGAAAAAAEPAAPSFQGHHVLRRGHSRRDGRDAPGRRRRLPEQAVQRGPVAGPGPVGPAPQGCPGPHRLAQPPTADHQRRAGT